MVVWTQCGGLLSHYADPRYHVLFRAEGSGTTSLQLPFINHSLLVAGVRLHLGGPPSSFKHRAAKLAADARNDFFSHALGSLLGWDAERFAHAAGSVAQAAHGSGAKVFCRRFDVLWDGYLRRTFAFHQIRKRARALHGLDHCPCARWGARLERLHGGRYDLLASSSLVEQAAI